MPRLVGLCWGLRRLLLRGLLLLAAAGHWLHLAAHADHKVDC
jgi:hypothetical protein